MQEAVIAGQNWYPGVVSHFPAPVPLPSYATATTYDLGMDYSSKSTDVSRLLNTTRSADVERVNPTSACYGTPDQVTSASLLEAS